MLNSYPWYLDDWLHSETRRRLTNAERGIYRDLIDLCYLDGSLSGVRRELIASLQSVDRQFGRSLDRVLSLFELRDGRYYHRKVEDVRGKLLAYHEAKAHAGVKSGQARRNRKNEQVFDSVRTTPTPTPSPALVNTHTQTDVEPPAIPVCVPQPPKPRPPVAADTSGQVSQRFEDFWSLYPRRVGKDAACRQWVSVVTVAIETAALDCLGRYLASGEVARGVVQSPVNWLSACHRDGWECVWPPPPVAVAQPEKLSATERAKRAWMDREGIA